MVRITKEELLKELVTQLSVCDITKLVHIQNSIFSENMRVNNITNDSVEITQIGAYFLG